MPGVFPRGSIDLLSDDPALVQGQLDRIARLSREEARKERLTLHWLCGTETPAVLDVVARVLAVQPEWVNAADPQQYEGSTPIGLAAANGHLRMVKVLAAHGGDPVLQNIRGRNALVEAVGSENQAGADGARLATLVEAVLDVGTFSGADRVQALWDAVSHGHAGAGAVAPLLARLGEADMALLDEGSSILASACFTGEDNPSSETVVRMLLAQPTLANHLNRGWHTPVNTPLHVAAANGNRPVMAALLEAGAWLNSPDGRPARTPLMHAAAQSQPEALRFLLDRGANVNDVDADGRTALHHLAGSDDSHLDDVGPAANRVRRLPSLAVLLEAGADPRAVDQAGRTPLDLAVAAQKRAVAAGLRKVAFDQTWMPAPARGLAPRL